MLDFISKIDHRLNKLEPYFHTRWLNLGWIRKADTSKEPGHIVLEKDGTKVFFAYSTICKFAPMPCPTELEPDRVEMQPCLNLAHSLERYTKTWGSVDYIICEAFKDNVTAVFYLDAKKFLAFLPLILTDKVEVSPGILVERRFVGNECSLSFLQKHGFVAMVDRVAWKKVTVEVMINKSPWPTPKQFERMSKCHFLYTWKKYSPVDRKRANDWLAFKLRMKYQDRSKITTIIEPDGTLHVFASQTAAAKAYKVNKAAISDCIAGRQKTFKIDKGRCKVATISGSDNSVHVINKRNF